MQISHIKHENINYQRWDEIISSSKNRMIYPFSWYLDAVSPGWEALMSDDLQYVMPLPVKKKFGLKYLVQPVLTQQLGIFSANKITEEIVATFVRAIPYFSYEMNLNENNFANNLPKLPNLLLNLNIAYENISGNFSVNTLRNIRKAEKYQLKIDWQLNEMAFLRFLHSEQKHYPIPNKILTKKLIINAIEHHSVSLIGVKTQNDKLIASLGLFLSEDRLIYLIPSSSIEGKEKSAMFFLVNEIIKKYAGTEKILDFEGSRIEGVSRFYKGFGAKSVSYYVIKKFRPRFLIKK